MWHKNLKLFWIDQTTYEHKAFIQYSKQTNKQTWYYIIDIIITIIIKEKEQKEHCSYAKLFVCYITKSAYV